jgi:hypothetical protein
MLSNNFFYILKVDVIPVHREGSDESLHTIQLKVYQPRVRRLRGGRVLVNHPVNEDLERKLSKPFYFRQYDHGTVVDAFMPKTDDYQAIALKKGMIIFPKLFRYW